MNSSESHDERFGGIGRTYGQTGFERLRQAHVAIVGIGGVGSWAAEAVARSGVGNITLVDLDDVCLTNINRQIHALSNTIGKSKTAVMAERIQAISPKAKVSILNRFYTENASESFFEHDYDWIIDAIDGLQQKAHLVAEAVRRKRSIITVGGAGGRIDPLKIEIDDLARTHGDRLCQALRKRLRAEYGFPRDSKKKFRVPCVFSTEPPRYPWADGSVCEQREPGSIGGLHCDSGFGTVTHLAASMGFAAAGFAINKIAEGI